MALRLFGAVKLATVRSLTCTPDGPHTRLLVVFPGLSMMLLRLLLSLARCQSGYVRPMSAGSSGRSIL
jgi:hypothetical protein